MCSFYKADGKNRILMQCKLKQQISKTTNLCSINNNDSVEFTSVGTRFSTRATLSTSSRSSFSTIIKASPHSFCWSSTRTILTPSSSSTSHTRRFPIWKFSDQPSVSLIQKARWIINEIDFTVPYKQNIFHSNWLYHKMLWHHTCTSFGFFLYFINNLGNNTKLVNENVLRLHACACVYGWGRYLSYSKYCNSLHKNFAMVMTSKMMGMIISIIRKRTVLTSNWIGGWRRVKSNKKVKNYHKLAYTPFHFENRWMHHHCILFYLHWNIGELTPLFEDGWSLVLWKNLKV